MKLCAPNIIAAAKFLAEENGYTASYPSTLASWLEMLLADNDPSPEATKEFISQRIVGALVR